MYSAHELNFWAKERQGAELKNAARSRLYRQAKRQRSSGSWIGKLAGALSQIGASFKAASETANDINPQSA